MSYVYIIIVIMCFTYDSSVDKGTVMNVHISIMMDLGGLFLHLAFTGGVFHTIIHSPDLKIKSVFGLFIYIFLMTVRGKMVGFFCQPRPWE